MGIIYLVGGSSWEISPETSPSGIRYIEHEALTQVVDAFDPRCHWRCHGSSPLCDAQAHLLFGLGVFLIDSL